MTDASAATAGGRRGQAGRSVLSGLPEATVTAVTVTAAWLILITAVSVYRQDFLSHQTVLAIAFTMSVSGVLVVGQALVTISGGVLDLSVPTLLILPAYVVATMIGRGVPEPPAVGAAIAAGALFGLLNATIIVFGRLNPLVVTLGTNFIGSACLFLTFGRAGAPAASGLRAFGGRSLLGLPSTFWPMLVLVAVVAYLLPRTRYGLRTLAVGGNATAAKARGISLRRTRFGVFTAAGACGGVAGVLFASVHATFTPGEGGPFLFSTIAGVILSGISLTGGRGSLWAVLPSVGLLSTIPTALVFFGLESTWQIVFQGLILMIAVAADGWTRRKAAR